MLTTFFIVLILCPLLPLLPSSHWTIRFFDFVRVQTAVIQLFLLAISFFIWDVFFNYHIIVFSLLTGVLAYQLWLIQPYTLFYSKHKPRQKLHQEQITLVTANVLQTNHEYAQFIEVIKDANPQIFITMESDEQWDQQISKAFPEYEHTLKATLDNFYGMHIYSKIPFDTSEIKYLVEKDIPSMHCKIKFADQYFNLIAIHPTPPSPTENDTSKERDAELMIVGEQCRKTTEATIVCGDLNDVVWSKNSRLFKKITGYRDPRVGRGLYPSFHAKMWLLRFPLDHLFYSKDLHVTEISRLKPFGSDHFAMFYRIAFSLKDIEVANPSISDETKEEVKDIIEEGHQSAQESE